MPDNLSEQDLLALFQNKMPSFLQSLKLVKETNQAFKIILQRLLQENHSFGTHFLHASLSFDQIADKLLKTGKFSFDFKYFHTKIEKYANQEILNPPFFKVAYGPIEEDPEYPSIPNKGMIKIDIIFLLHPSNL